MLNHKKIIEDSASFFNKEVDKTIKKAADAKTQYKRIKHIKELMALKNRLILEVKMLNEME